MEESAEQNQKKNVNLVLKKEVSIAYCVEIKKQVLDSIVIGKMHKLKHLVVFRQK